MPPYFANEWEKEERKCVIAYLAKGSITILHYFDEEMVEEYNKRIARHNGLCKVNYPLIDKENLNFEAMAYFSEEIKAFFEDATVMFHEDIIKTRAFFWLQGESDATLSETEYWTRLEMLWKKLKVLGFTHFFCIRVGMWGDKNITEIMKIQENFCAQNESCYMLTRSCSFMPLPDEYENLSYIKTPDEKYFNCRDSFYGFPNNHINEKGHALIAKQAAANAKRILAEGGKSEPEEELVAELI